MRTLSVRARGWSVWRAIAPGGEARGRWAPGVAGQRPAPLRARSRRRAEASHLACGAIFRCCGRLSSLSKFCEKKRKEEPEAWRVGHFLSLGADEIDERNTAGPKYGGRGMPLC